MKGSYEGTRTNEKPDVSSASNSLKQRTVSMPYVDRSIETER